jgi:peptidoglycan/xylan/chitin deacetylase (PgdA/CDA1 family)
MAYGKFIISLDFELHWGGAEKWDLSDMSNYFLETRKSIPLVLEIFKKNKIKATWATVGFLFAKNKRQLLQFSPTQKPAYKNQSLSYYNIFDQVGEDEINDPFHFGYSLIEKIIQTSGQELATHTFAHYYCNEEGQNILQFEADLKSAQAIAKENFKINLKSLVFPRNQYNPEYLKVAKEQGIEVVRSNPEVWFWQKKYGRFTPIFRAIDTLLQISKSVTFNNSQIKKNEVIILPASRFFRPFLAKEKNIQRLKLNRIKKEMTFAAKNAENYHLWWHPHNFGYNVEENIKQLNEIIEHYSFLSKKYNFQSCSMEDFL